MALLHRYLCDVLEDIRSAFKVIRIDLIPGLVEEAQIMGNKMEAKLGCYSDLGYNINAGEQLMKQLDGIKKAVESLEKETERIRNES